MNSKALKKFIIETSVDGLSGLSAEVQSKRLNRLLYDAEQSQRCIKKREIRKIRKVQ